MSDEDSSEYESYYKSKDPLDRIYSLCRRILAKDCNSETRNSSVHEIIDEMSEDVIRRVRDERHGYCCVQLATLMIEVVVAAIGNYAKNEKCCYDALTCLGKGVGAVLASAPDRMLSEQTVDQRLVDFILDAISDERTSKNEMRFFSRACKELHEWASNYPNPQHGVFFNAISNKMANNLHKLEVEDISRLMMNSYISRSAINNDALFAMIERELVTATSREKKGNLARIVICHLDDIGQDREKLEDRIGRGFLEAAASSHACDLDYSVTIKVLETVIDVFPCCKGMIKRLLDGATRAVRDFAQLAETIEIEPTKRGVYHLQWEEEHEESTEDTNESSGEATTPQTRIMVDSQGSDALSHEELVQSESDGEQTRNMTQDSQGFDLPLEILVRILGMLTVDQIADLRGSCRQARQAVQSYFNQLKLKKLIESLWPEQSHQFGTLKGIIKEVQVLVAWASRDHVESIDFTGVEVMTSGQLEAALGKEPLVSVTKITLTDVLILPQTWKRLAHLFPNLTTLTFTEATSQFPDDFEGRNEGRDATWSNCDKSMKAGLLEDKRKETLSIIAKLFYMIQNVHIE